MTKFTSLEDIAKEFHRATETETQSLFIQGRIILDAVGQGWDVDEVAAYCGASVGRSKRTAYRRYSVARTFPKPHPAKTWEYFAICADIVDYRSNDQELILQQQQKAQEWLNRSIAEQWGTRALKAAMKAAGEDVDVDKPEVLVDGAIAIVMNPLYGGHTMSLHFINELDFDIPAGAEIQVTIVKATTQEKVTP